MGVCERCCFSDTRKTMEEINMSSMLAPLPSYAFEMDHSLQCSPFTISCCCSSRCVPGQNLGKSHGQHRDSFLAPKAENPLQMEKPKRCSMLVLPQHPKMHTIFLLAPSSAPTMGLRLFVLPPLGTRDFL